MCSKGFTVDDLTNMLNIIETCTNRGAFQAAELSGVGAFYDKLKLCKDSLNNKDKKVTDKCVGGKCPLKNDDDDVVEQEKNLEEVCDGGKCYLSPSTVRV